MAKENYTQRHRNGTQNDDHPRNLDDGPLTSPGSHSIKGDLDRAIREQESITQALEESLLPTTWDHKTAATKAEKAELKKVETSVRQKLYGKLHEAMDKNLSRIGQAYDDYFEKLDSDDDSKEAAAVKAHFRANFVNPEMLKEMEAARAKQLQTDYDFQQFRIFKLAHYYQQQMMLSKSTVNLVMAGRRSGKTEGNIMLTDYTVVVPNKRVLIIALTYETASQLYWHPILKQLEAMDIPVTTKDSKAGMIYLANDGLIKLTGNSSADEREKLRGGKWDVVIIDEVQSQKALPYLVHDIIEPMLLDRKGKLYLTGTGPRVRGTLWEAMWNDLKSAFRLNWNLTQNPFIPDHEIVLEKIRTDKGLKENDPLYVREYLGQIAYDDDALVVRLSPENFYDETQLRAWIASQPASDMKFIGGLDYGHSDSDAFVIVLYSDSSPYCWIVYQYKANLQGITELADSIKRGLDFVATDNRFAMIPRSQREDFFIFADSSDGRASSDLQMMLKINIFSAYKYDKTAAIDFLQDDVRRGWLKVEKLENDMTPLEDEAMKTLFKRDEKDNLTREIDDDTYHPDVIPALQYALRSGPWMYRSANHIEA